MIELTLCQDLVLPIDVVTQTVGILAKRRSGKSYLARRFYEELHRTGQQIVIVDPKGDHWGARSGADGKSPGMPIVILGGDHGDLPLAPESGAVVARLVVEERVSVLLDLSLLRKHEVATFMAVFLEDLYRLKARAEYRTPLMLFVDEADAIAPQKPQPNEMRMLGAMNDVVRRGGQRGLGCCVITQRSAVLSKDVLTQVQVLIALRTMSPQDLAAIKAWIDVHGTLEQQKVLMASLPSLPIGDAWFWSPGWPTDAGIFQRSHVLPISTFDSGATPKAGETAVAPKRLADVDLEAVRRQMAATIEKAQENDPTALRARIKELELLVASGAGPLPAPALTPAFGKDLADALIGMLGRTKREQSAALYSTIGVVMDLEETCRKLHTALDALKTSVDDDATSLELEKLFPSNPPTARVAAVAPTTKRAAAAPATKASVSGLPPGELAMLEIVMQRKGGATDSYVILCTGYRNGSVTSYASRLVSRGLITRSGSRSFATAEAFATMPSPKKLPTGAKLVEHYINTLPPGEALVVGCMSQQLGRALDTDKLVKLTGRPAGSITSYVSRLRTREIIVGKGHELAFNPELGL